MYILGSWMLPCGLSFFVRHAVSDFIRCQGKGYKYSDLVEKLLNDDEKVRESRLNGFASARLP